MVFRTPFVTILISLILIAWCLKPTPTLGKGAVLRSSTPTSVDHVVIDPAAIKRTLPSTFFGLNYSGFWDDAQGSSASARALAQTPIRSVRFPGGVPADWYDWQDPRYKHRSRTSPAQLWHWARSFASSRVLFQTNYQGNLPNPPGKPYAVNSPKNAAAWVAYNSRIGIPAYMEVGNEEDMNTMHVKDDPGFEPYITAFNAQAKAMHQANPRVRVLGPAGTNEYFWWHLDGLGMFLRGAGNRTGSGQADGVSLHFYAANNWDDAKGKAQYWLSPQGTWVGIQKMIRAHDTRKLPVYITEWNLGNSDANNHNAFTPTLGHALVTADMIGAFAVSGVTQEDYFVVHDAHNWGLLYGQGEDRPADSPTPTYYAMALWKHMGNQVVRLKQSDDAASVMSTYATTRKNGSVQVLAIIKQLTPRTVQVALQGASPRGHRLHVYSLRGVAGSVQDLDVLYDGKKMPSPQRRLPGPRNSGIIHGNTVSYRVPGNSAVILEIGGTTRAPGLMWKAPSLTPPPPSPSFSVTGHVAHPTLNAGQTQALTVTIRSTSDIGPTLVDFEIYDSTRSKVFQATRTVDIRANKPVTVTRNYATSSAAYSGEYHLAVGLFGPKWSPAYSWNGQVDSFNVAGISPPNVSVTAQAEPDHLRGGATVALSAAVSVTGSNLPRALVDFEIYNASGVKTWQSTQTGIDISQGAITRLIEHWTVPAGQANGGYTLKIGVFGANWSPLYVWNDKAATLTIDPATPSARVDGGGSPAFSADFRSLLAGSYHLLRTGGSWIRHVSIRTAREVITRVARVIGF